MQEDRTYNKEKSFRIMRTIYDVTMGVLMMGVAIVVLMAEKWSIEQLLVWEPWMRIFFGCVLLLYGSFRIYRGIKQQR
jgi:ABC-type nickel/cobalt efflux system permease component RcnA